MLNQFYWGKCKKGIVITLKYDISCFSNEQRSGANPLLQDNEQTGRLHVDADVRYRGLLLQKRRRTEHHLCQLCH